MNYSPAIILEFLSPPHRAASATPVNSPPYVSEMTHTTFTDLPGQAQNSLIKLANVVAGVIPIEVRSWSFKIADLPMEPESCLILNELSNWANKGKNCLYYFEWASIAADLKAIEQAFVVAKTREENDRAYPRLNEKNACLYVGSSKSIAKRFREHLGYNSPRTYALQLMHWARRFGLDIRFVCAKYADDTPYSIVQALEDSLWETKRPMFGRQGRK